MEMHPLWRGHRSDDPEKQVQIGNSDRMREDNEHGSNGRRAVEEHPHGEILSSEDAYETFCRTGGRKSLQ